MKPQSAFVWRVRLSLLLLAFGSLIVDQEGTSQAPLETNAAVASRAARAGVLTVKAPGVKRHGPERPPKARQRHLADARIDAAITAPGPQ